MKSELTFFAFGSFPPNWASALEGVDFVGTFSSVETRSRQALVDLNLAPEYQNRIIL